MRTVSRHLLIGLLLCLVALFLVGCELSGGGGSGGATVSGTISFEEGEIYIRAMVPRTFVGIRGTGFYTYTSPEGHFAIYDVPSGDYTLVFDTGKENGTLPINVPGEGFLAVEGVVVTSENVNTDAADLAFTFIPPVQSSGDDEPEFESSFLGSSAPDVESSGFTGVGDPYKAFDPVDDVGPDPKDDVVLKQKKKGL